MQTVTSTSNSKYKYIKSLSNKKKRYEYGEYTVEGIKSVRDAMNSSKVISLLAVSADFMVKEDFSYPQNIETVCFETNIFNKLCDTKTPQGIIAIVEMTDTYDFSYDLDKPYIYCDGVSDPGNLGTIIRTADAAGFGGVLLSEGCADVYNPKVVRSSMGSFFNIDILSGQTAKELIKLKMTGFNLVGGALSQNTVDYRCVDLKKPTVIVVGNESNGISAEVLELCECVKIPILGNAESLNVSVASAILMYELVRQRT